MKDGGDRILILEKTAETMMDTFSSRDEKKIGPKGPDQTGQLQYKLALFEQVNGTRWPSEISCKDNYSLTP